MPLIHYRQFLTYPDGNPAANTTFPVWNLGGNVLIPLFSDKLATPLANPLMTDAEGLLEFFAPPGSYTVNVAGAIVHALVALTELDDAWPGTFVHTQALAAAVWTVDHHFGIEPSVNVVTGGNVVEADIAHPTTAQTVITFSSPQSGTAHLRR